ncbi:hypothetical protein ACFQ14_09600 [Pseudahrensia aquimaris]|uniref:UrcA family protein n=1 Tax=Pseudahrensia aquimaris TaxID=744461 RepID=A0ABW3FEQ7_9HYPH
MRTLIVLALTTATLSTALASNFTLYPGFRDRDALVEAATDKGLIVEVILRCERTKSGKIKSGIMVYSKVEDLYCSSKNRCFRDAEKAFDDTCY